MGSFGALVSKWPVTRKQLCRRVKISEIWDSGTLVNTYMGYIDLVGFKVNLGLFGAIVSKWPVSLKHLIIEQNGVKLGTRGY